MRKKLIENELHNEKEEESKVTIIKWGRIGGIDLNSSVKIENYVSPKRQSENNRDSQKKEE